MGHAQWRTLCWKPLWNKGREGDGLEHLLLAEREANSVVLAFDEEQGPFRLTYRLTWDDAWRLRDAEIALARVSLDNTGLFVYPGNRFLA
jgi:hypothetical protein